MAVILNPCGSVRRLLGIPFADSTISGLHMPSRCSLFRHFRKKNKIKKREGDKTLSSPLFHELPNDLETAQVIIEGLTKQLKVHDDVSSNLALLQKRVEDSHQRTQNALQMLESRLDSAEGRWTRQLEIQHKYLLKQYNKEIKNQKIKQAFIKKTGTDSTLKETDNDAKVQEHELKILNHRAAKVDSGMKELSEITTSTINIEENLKTDKEKIRDFDARLKILSKREEMLNAVLTKHMNIYFRKQIKQSSDKQSDASFYGVCEIIDGYQKTVVNLNKALRKLEQVRFMPAMRTIDCTSLNVPTVDEIDEITIVMRRFLAKLRVQLSTVHLTGSPAANSRQSSRSSSIYDFNSKLSSSTSAPKLSFSNLDVSSIRSTASTNSAISSSALTSKSDSQFLLSASTIPSCDLVVAAKKSQECGNDAKK
ncbi:unnamed protein product [Thelazia callipaeda]|uniref:DUF4200 domain-containing protein n=1 Tax=Thelazia callipaeda TaxID=103827 RepID=A0A0N5D4A4_THECL|nr:unnamed protein product [Thelazia callipaeda]